MVTARNHRVEIDRASAEPVYRQLADIIRGRIESGRYPPGTLIPSIERIRQETGVAVMTIRKGIGILAAEGWVLLVPGKGTFVNPREQWPDG
jgi:DNA-binding GntR family transcriptional regulator